MTSTSNSPKNSSSDEVEATEAEGAVSDALKEAIQK